MESLSRSSSYSISSTPEVSHAPSEVEEIKHEQAPETRDLATLSKHTSQVSSGALKQPQVNPKPIDSHHVQVSTGNGHGKLEGLAHKQFSEKTDVRPQDTHLKGRMIDLSKSGSQGSISPSMVQGDAHARLRIIEQMKSHSSVELIPNRLARGNSKETVNKTMDMLEKNQSMKEKEKLVFTALSKNLPTGKSGEALKAKLESAVKEAVLKSQTEIDKQVGPLREELQQQFSQYEPLKVEDPAFPGDPDKMLYNDAPLNPTELEYTARPQFQADLNKEKGIKASRIHGLPPNAQLRSIMDAEYCQRLGSISRQKMGISPDDAMTFAKMYIDAPVLDQLDKAYAKNADDLYAKCKSFGKKMNDGVITPEEKAQFKQDIVGLDWLLKNISQPAVAKFRTDHQNYASFNKEFFPQLNPHVQQSKQVL